MGDLKVLEQLIHTARVERDIGIAEMFNDFFLPFDATERDRQEARDKDGQEYVDWLSS